LAYRPHSQQFGVERIAERLGAHPAHQGMVCQFMARHVSIRPNRRGSLNVTVAPDDMWNTTTFSHSLTLTYRALPISR
jgi:hypothetical protein